MKRRDGVLDSPIESLREDHTPARVAERLASPNSPHWLRDAVLGSVDGCVTTLALVAGVYGAGLTPGVALVLGLANLTADGFSMAVGVFEASRVDIEAREAARRTEENHIETVPEGEREEVRQLFAQKGFSGEQLEQAVATITDDRERWVNLMLSEEYGIAPLEYSPWRSALTTFGAFVSIGILPLVPLFFRTGQPERALLLSAVIGAIVMFLVGVVKGSVLGRSKLKSGLLTLVSGGMAAGLALAIGITLSHAAGT